MKVQSKSIQYLTLDSFIPKKQIQDEKKVLQPEYERPGIYNVKAFYYIDGTQYRVYSRPVRRKTEAEKKRDKALRAFIPDKKRKYSTENFQPSVPLEYCPFTEEMEDFRMSFEECERSRQVSLNRSKQNLIGICRANVWDLFITFTFNPRLVDSSNYEDICLKAGKWLNNYKNRYCPHMKYVLVPELHKDGVHYHLHGLLADCPELPLHVSGHTDRKGDIIYNIPAWKYGWNTATKVGHSGKVSSYISKYITKDTDGLLHGKRRYWASHNVLLSDEVCEEFFIEDHFQTIEHLSLNGSIKFFKKSHIMQCNRDIWYIET